MGGCSTLSLSRKQCDVMVDFYPSVSWKFYVVLVGGAATGETGGDKERFVVNFGVDFCAVLNMLYELCRVVFLSIIWWHAAIVGRSEKCQALGSGVGSSPL